jgi:hypothetical protein
MKWVVTPVDHSTSHPSSAALRKRCTGGSRSRSKKKGGRASGGPSSPRLDFRGAPSASGQRSSLRFCATWRLRGRHPQEGACRALVAQRFLSSLHVSQIPSLARSGVGSWAFRRLTLVPSIIIVPGEEELPARCQRQPSPIEAESLAHLRSVPRVERHISCLKLFHHPLGVFGLQANHRHPSPAWLGRRQPHELCRYAQAPAGLQVPILLLTPSARKLLQKPPPGLFLFS